MWSVFRPADRLGPAPRAEVTHEVERLIGRRTEVVLGSVHAIAPCARVSIRDV
jgi:hypothetical protein